MPTRIRWSLALTILVTALVSPSSAQEVTRIPDAARQSVGVEGGLESAFVARTTYAHRVELPFLTDARLFARFTLPIARHDLGAWDVAVGLRATPVSWGSLRLAVLAGPLLRRTVNELFSATATGISATALFGYEGARWGLGAELGYDQVLVTHLRHSARYRNESYAGAKDGWYAMSGSTARVGLRGGVRFGAIEIAARAGRDATGQLHALTPPFYFTLGGAYAF